MKIVGIGHAAYNVTNMEKSLEYYCGILGFQDAFELADQDGNPWIHYIRVAPGQFLELFYNHNYSATNMEAQPDFVKLAEAYGAEGYRIEKSADLLPVLEKAFASDKTAFIDVVVEREENVYPIVPAGAALDEMLLV